MIKPRQPSNVFLSCVVTAFNEEDMILPFLKALNAQCEKMPLAFEIIVVDDGSRDNTAALVQSVQGVKLLRLSRNFGKEAAMTCGLHHAKGDAVVIIDSDFQHPIALLDVFYQEWLNGYDMIYGVREDRQQESFLKRQFAQLFYQLMNRLTETPIPPNAGDFRWMDRKVVDALTQCNEKNRFMKGLYAWVGFESKAIPFVPGERVKGQSRWGFSRLTELALTGITSFSSVPLRVWGWVGFVVSLIAFIYASFIVMDTLIYGVDLPGFATITVAVMFLGGIQLLSIGILGEYIGRVFNEVKQRPTYIVQEKIGFADEKSN